MFFSNSTRQELHERDAKKVLDRVNANSDNPVEGLLYFSLLGYSTRTLRSINFFSTKTANIYVLKLHELMYEHFEGVYVSSRGHFKVRVPVKPTKVKNNYWTINCKRHEQLIKDTLNQLRNNCNSADVSQEILDLRTQYVDIINHKY